MRGPNASAPSITTAAVSSAAAMRTTISNAGMRGAATATRTLGISTATSEASPSASAAPAGPLITHALSASSVITHTVQAPSKHSAQCTRRGMIRRDIQA